MTETLIAKLDGGLARTGMVPAFAALESAEAFSQAVSVIIHYARSGEIRRKRIKDLESDLLLVGTREGSFEFIFQYADQAEHLGVFAANAVAGGVTWDLIKRVFLTATGQLRRERVEELDDKVPSGDFGALVQATEPAIRKAHNVINHGSGNITIFVNGDDNSIQLSGETKAYMNEEVFNNEVRSQRFLVTSYDGRNRTGRMFDLEAEQAFTFDLLADADRESLETIVAAAGAFALREKGKFDAKMEVVARFTSIDTMDGRAKRLKVLAVRRDYSDLGPDDDDDLLLDE